MQKPFFSVAIPALNEEKYLPSLLEDLSKQSFADFDVWVCDGNSDDKTAEIVQKSAKQDKRIHLCTSPIRGVGTQRNCAARASTGEYLVFFDADTRIPPYFLEGVHYHLLKEKFDAWSNLTASESEQPIDLLYTFIFNMYAEITATTNSPGVSGGSMGISRKAFDEVDGFDESITFAEDQEIVLRIIKKGYAYSILKDPEFIYNFRRVRKDGYIPIGVGLLPAIIKILKNEKITDPIKTYPMLGGSYFSTKIPPKKHTLIKEINGFSLKLKQRIRKQDKEIRKLLKDALGEF